MEHKSHRMDITQLPRDANGSLGLLRSTLVKTFNYCRPHPTKLATLKLVVKYVYNRIVELEKYNLLVEADKAAKAEAIEKAAKEQADADALVLAKALKEAEDAAKLLSVNESGNTKPVA